MYGVATLAVTLVRDGACSHGGACTCPTARRFVARITGRLLTTVPIVRRSKSRPDRALLCCELHRRSVRTMRLLAAFVIAHAVLVLSGCGAVRPTVAAPVPTAGPSIDTASPAKAERLDVDTPRTTVAGNTFVAPAGWTIAVRGAATLLEAPEGGSFIAIVDVRASDANAAVAAAWGAYKPGARWPLKAVTPIADRDGWTDRRDTATRRRPTNAAMSTSMSGAPAIYGP